MKIPQEKKNISNPKTEVENSLNSEDQNQDADLLKELMGLSSDIFFRIDLKGFLNYLSPSAEKLLIGGKEKWNKDSKSLLTDNPVNKDSLDKILLLAQQGKSVTPCRLEIHGKDGQKFSLEIHGKPIYEKEKVVAYAGLGRDITNLLNAEESLEIQKKRAQKELELAAHVHSTLIPLNLENDHVSIAINYLPVSGVGGDYTNYKLLSDGNIIFFIGDVTGHGVPAALLVNRLDSEFERLAKVKPQPGKLLNRFNNFIKENFEGTRMFLSAFCGLINFATMRFTYSNYGHPPQFLFQAKNSNILSMPAQTHLVGLSHQKQSTNFESVIDVEPGDRIFCYTDGVVEADQSDFKMFGFERLKEFIIKNQQLSIADFNEKLVQEVMDFSSNKLDDDTCILSIGIKNPQP